MGQRGAKVSPAFGADEEARLKNSAARLSVLVAAFLIALKTATGLFTGSISVWASLLDSAMDIFASTINFFAVRAAARPPDEEHIYGHGKTDSPALTADAAHYATDVYTNGAALFALVVVALTRRTLADPLISILISAFILWSAFRVARDSVDVLMDRRLPQEVDETVAGIVRRFRPEGVIGFHDLRTRRSGSVKFIELHLEVTRDQSFLGAHDLTERVITAIETVIPRSHVQIHCDPEGGK